MINFFLNFIKHSYHRPTAKLEHFFVLFLKIFFNKKTKLFSEKLFLLKLPPFSMIYFNFLGRFFYATINFISIILFQKFADKSLSIETSSEDVSHIKKTGDDLSPWPNQALHLNESSKEIDKDHFEKIFNSYNKSIIDLEKESFKDSPWWNELRQEFNKTFIESNSRINIKNLINFRNEIDSKAAILKDQNIAINKKNSKIINMINAIWLVCLYHKYSEVVDLNILRIVSDSWSVITNV